MQQGSGGGAAADHRFPLRLSTPSATAEGVVIWGSGRPGIDSTAMPALLTLLLPLPLAVAAVLARLPPARRLGWLGALAFALGAASVRVALRLALDQAADPLWVAALPTLSLRIDAGLQLLGAMLALGSGAWSALRSRSGIDRASAVIAVLTAVAMIVVAGPLIRIGGYLPTLAAATALGIGAAFIGATLALVRDRISASRGKPPSPRGSAPRSGRWSLALLVGGLAVLFTPHLDLVFGGAIVAAAAAYALQRRVGAVRLPIFPAVVAGALGFAGYYLHVIAGPDGVWLAALPEAPLSAAAQALIVPALALGAVGFFVFRPLGSLPPGPWLAPIGVALLLRVGAEALPLGMDGWRTVTIPIGVAAAWAAAVTRRPLLLASAAAWMACFAPAGGGAAGAWILALVSVGGAGVGSAARRLATATFASTARECVLAALAALGAALALDGLLRAEVVYTVMSAGAAAFSAVYISRADT